MITYVGDIGLLWSVSTWYSISSLANGFHLFLQMNIQFVEVATRR